MEHQTDELTEYTTIDTNDYMKIEESKQRLIKPVKTSIAGSKTKKSKKSKKGEKTTKAAV